MEWDLGWQGLGTLLVLSVAFGVFTQAVFWGRASLWLGVIAGAISFVVGLFISEVMFGWATEADLQPNIDGLSFDEVVLGFLLGGALVLVGRFLVRGRTGPLALR